MCALGALITGPILLVLAQETFDGVSKDYKEILDASRIINKDCASVNKKQSCHTSDGLWRWYSCGHDKCTGLEACRTKPWEGLLHCGGPYPGKASCTGHCAWGPANVTSGEALYCDAKLKAEEVALGATSCFIAVPIFLKDWIGGLECCAACGGGDCGGGDCGSCCASSKQWERTAPKARHVTAHGRCPRARRLRIAPQPTTYPPHASLPPPRPSPSVRQAADFSPGAR